MNPKLGEEVGVHYQIFYVDEKNEEIELENTKDNSPFRFEIAKSTLAIEFFSDHAITMKPNDSKTINTTVEKLYGLFGHPLFGLSPSAPLKVELTLVEIYASQPASPESSTLYDRALKCKEDGNSMVSQQKFEEAKKFYLAGISLFNDVLTQSATRSAETETLLVQMFNNMALCDLKLKNYNSAMDTCATVCDLTSKDEAALAKAHFRFGMALEELRSMYSNILSLSINILDEHLKNKGNKADKDWCTKEARYHYLRSNVYAKETDQNVKKRILLLNKIITAPKGFAGMFARADNVNRGLSKF